LADFSRFKKTDVYVGTYTRPSGGSTMRKKKKGKMKEPAQTESKPQIQTDSKTIVTAIAAALVIIVIVIGAVMGLLVFLAPNTTQGKDTLAQGTLTAGNNQAKAAILSAVQGDVSVDSGSGYKSAVSGASLLVGYKVKTGPTGKATIAFYDNGLMRLDENTEIEIKSLSSDGHNASVGLEQDSGSTWNRVLSIAGKTNYQVQTPDAVATVRGTAFGLDLTKGFDYLFVSAGNVSFGKKGAAPTNVTELNAAIFNSTSGNVEKVGMTEESRLVALKNAEQDFSVLKANRKAKVKEFLDQHSLEVSMLKSQYNVTDEQINNIIENATVEQINQYIGPAAQFIPKDMIDYINNSVQEESKILSEIAALNQTVNAQ